MRLCSFCSTDNKIASVACETCTYFYCPACVQKLHPNLGPFQGHKIVKASDFQSKQNVCEAHRERFSVFCQQCLQLLCLKCIAQHATHHLLNIDEALLSAKEDLSNYYQQLEASLKFSTSLEKEVKQQKSNLQAMRTEAIKKIKTECKFLRTTISDCEKSMVKSIEQEVQEKTTQLEQMLNFIPKISLSSTKVLNEISGVLKQDNVGLVLSKYGSLSMGAEEQLEQIHPIKGQDEVQLSFNPEEFSCAEESRMLTDKLKVNKATRPGERGDLSRQTSTTDRACSETIDTSSNLPSSLAVDNAKICPVNFNTKFIALLNNMEQMSVREKGGRGLRQRRSGRTRTSKHSVSRQTVMDDENEPMLLSEGSSQMNANAHNNSDCKVTKMSKRDEVGSLQEYFTEETSEVLETGNCSRHATLASLPTTTAGITQRWKGNYYANYTLTSERLWDRQFQQLINEPSPQTAEVGKEGTIQEVTNGDACDM